MVMQQPAAYRDAIIVGWCMEELAKDCPRGCMQQHDLVGCQSTAAIKKLRQHLHQLDAIVAGDMTACLQLTDIMCAKKVKDIARDMAAFIKAWLKRKAAAKEEEVKYVIGPREILMIVNKIHDGLLEWLEKYDWIYAGARQGGHLAYLPDMKSGRLQKLEEFLEEWRETMGDPTMKPPPMGGGKVEYDWLTERYDWLNENGVPKTPQWEKEHDGEDMRLKRQVDLSKQKLDENSVLICVDEEEIFEEYQAILQDHPAFREAKFQKMLDKIGSMEAKTKKPKKLAAEAVGVQEKSARRRIRAVEAKRQLSEHYGKASKQYLQEGCSRQELARRVALSAGKKKNGGKKGGKPSLALKEVKKSIEKGAQKKILGKLALQMKQKAKEMVKHKAYKVWMEKQPEFAKAPLLGKEVRSCKQQRVKLFR